jgi:hypothetical protein
MTSSFFRDSLFAESGRSGIALAGPVQKKHQEAKRQHRQAASNVDDVRDDGMILARAGIVAAAEEQQRICNRADVIRGRLHQREAQVTRFELHSIKIF